MTTAFEGIFKGLTVLVTGHTGFKGSWLTLWLQKLGAQVIGYSLPPSSTSHFLLSHVNNDMVNIYGDICDYQALKAVIDGHNPEIIFHLAAQPIVLHGFSHPKQTFDTNVGGTINLLEAARLSPSVKAMVVVTTDKCYENKEWQWGYRENDPLGGQDPYSASKSMAEHAVLSYRKSFLENNSKAVAVATARAGNVIGGGDFSEFRILPDCMRSLRSQSPIEVRNPLSTRPWLYVLDSLSGYLWLATRLFKEGHKFAQAWNFGPLEHQGIQVQRLVEEAIHLWGSGQWVHKKLPNEKPEKSQLRLNWDKAAQELQWSPTYGWKEALEQTVEWYRLFNPQQVNSMRHLSLDQIDAYMMRSEFKQMPWMGSINNFAVAG